MIIIKKSVTIWAIEGGVNGKYDVYQAANLLNNVGFNSVELSVSQDGIINVNSSIDEIQHIKKKFDEKGIMISSLSTLLFNQVSITSTNYDEKAFALNLANKMLELASIAEIPTIQISPGRVTDTEDYKNVYDIAIRECIILSKRAKELGVLLTVENDWQNFLLSPLEFSGFIDDVNERNFGVCFDTGNSALYGFPEQWINILGNKIKKVHLTDLRITHKFFPKFCDINEGQLNIENICRTLKDNGYNNYLTLEVFFQKNIECNNRLEKLGKRLTNIIESL